MKHRGLGVLASGRGSNLEAILGASRRGDIPIPVRFVLSDNPDAGALRVARDQDIPCACIETPAGAGRMSPEVERKYVDALVDHGVDLVAMAGFMRVLHAVFLDAFPWAILNVHPSLLPAFPGLNAQHQALQWGVRWAGCTVHFVTRGVDSGPIIEQAVVPVQDDDTPESLAGRILAEEHRIYPAAIARVARGEFRIDGRRVLSG